MQAFFSEVAAPSQTNDQFEASVSKSQFLAGHPFKMINPDLTYKYVPGSTHKAGPLLLVAVEYGGTKRIRSLFSVHQLSDHGFQLEIDFSEGHTVLQDLSFVDLDFVSEREDHEFTELMTSTLIESMSAFLFPG